jgi:hypothetical protein
MTAIEPHPPMTTLDTTHENNHSDWLAFIRSNSLIIVTLILLLAAIGRIYHINQQSMWFDEAFAYSIVIQHDMFPRIKADTHPPLYYIALRGWMEVTGDSALSLRYLSALFSMTTVAITYQIGKELTRKRPLLFAVPALAMLIMALSDAEIFLAQEARNYAIYTCLASLSMWMYLRWLRIGSWKTALCWSLSTSALMYTHYQGAFIPAIQGLHALMFLRGRKRIEAVGALALAGAIFLPWFAGVTLPQAQHAIDNSLPYAIPTNWRTFLQLRDSFLGAQWALMILLAGLGAVVIAKSRADRFQWKNLGPAFLISMWFLLPFCVLFFGNLQASLLTERKLLIAFPGLAFLIAFGLGSIPRQARWLLVGAIILYGVSTVDFYRVKEPWDKISAEIIPYVEPNDVAMIEVGVGQYPVLYYWNHTMPDDVIVTTFPFLGDKTLGQTDWYTYYNAELPFTLNYSQGIRIGDVATVWMIFWAKEMTGIQRIEEAGYVRTMTITYHHLGNNIDIYRYDLFPDKTLATYENGMKLHSAEIDSEKLRVDLWWSADQTMDTDYTVSAVVLDSNGELVAQLDSFPQNGVRPTTTWQSAEIVYDQHWLHFVDGLTALPPGDYTVAVAVYRFASDGSIQHVLTDNGEELLTIGSFTR